VFPASRPRMGIPKREVYDCVELVEGMVNQPLALGVELLDREGRRGTLTFPQRSTGLVLVDVGARREVVKREATIGNQELREF